MAETIVEKLDWNIREARPGDWPAIAELNRLLALETEGKTLDMRLVEPGVRRLISEPALGRYFLAEATDRVIGQLAITFEWSDWRNGMLWWLQSVYVAAAWRGRGVFRSLYQYVENLGRRDADVCGIRLYVDERNTAAHGVYEALGFERAGYLVLEKSLRR